jgi:pimeloyl-ACP methyl ester carboxylesterase
MDVTTRTMTVDDGTEIAVTSWPGAEPAVVVLHGLAGSSREFVPTAEALSGRAVVLVDQRGHGASTRRPVDVSRAAFVADAVAVIRSVTTEPVVLVGQSMGAHTAMLVAAARPDLVRGLVLLEGDQGSGTAEDHAAIGAFFRSWPTPFPDRAAAQAALGDGPLAQAWVDDLEQRPDGLRPRFDADVMQAVIEGVGEPRWEEWESVTAPTLVLYADGGMFTADRQDAFVRRGRSVTVHRLRGASHDAHLDAFDQWIDALQTFLRSI